MKTVPITWQVLVLILVVGGLFGATFVLIKVALTSIPPFTIGLLRLVMAAATLLLALGWVGLRLPPLGRVWGSFTVMGLGNGALAYVLINWSAQYIEAGMVGILIATTPIFTVMLAHLFTSEERLRARTVLGVMVGFAGVVVLMGPGALLRFQFEGLRFWGMLAMVGAAVCYAVAAVHGRRLRDVPPLVTATAQQITGALAIAPVAFAFESPLSLHPRWQDLAIIALVGVFGTGLAYMLFFRVLALAGATRTSLITYVTPFSAVVLGAVILGERLPLRAFLAMALILVSMAIVGGRASDARATRPAGIAGD